MKLIKLYNFKNYIIFKINIKSFRNLKYLERYEDVVFDLEQTLSITPGNTNEQKREGLRIVADSSGEATPFDWYNSRLSVDFKVDKLADGAARTLTDQNGIVNGSNTLIKRLSITANGREVYSCNNANHCVNITTCKAIRSGSGIKKGRAIFPQ